MEVDDFPGWRHSYDAAVGLRKQRLVRGVDQSRKGARAKARQVVQVSEGLHAQGARDKMGHPTSAAQWGWRGAQYWLDN
jgi:hypothetical protein